MNALMKFFLMIYILALPTSLGVMEIAAWTIVLVSFPLFAFKKGETLGLPVGFYPALGLLVTALVSGLVNNLSGDEYLASVGKFRWLILYVVFYNLLRRGDVRQFIKKYWWAVMPPLFITACYGISQYWSGYDLFRGSDFFFPPAYQVNDIVHRWRSIGFFNLPLTYGYAFSVFSIGLICKFCFDIREGQKEYHKYLLLTLLVIGISILTTYTRGVWIAFACALIATLWFIDKKWLVGAVLGVSLIVGSYIFVDNNFRNRVSSITDMKNTSNSERLDHLKANWEIFKDNKWLGVGFDQNSFLEEAYFEELEIVGTKTSHAHNTYLNFAAGLGLFGLGFYLLFIGSLLMATLKSLWGRKPEGGLYHVAAAFLGTQAVVYVGGLTECNFKDAEITHLFIFCCSVFSAYLSLSEESGKKAAPMLAN